MPSRTSLRRRLPGHVSRRRPRRAFAVFVITSCFFLSITLRLYQLQVLKCDEYRELADGQHKMGIELKPLRGRIYARTGEELATSLTRESIGVWPAQLESSVRAAELLAGATGISSGELVRLFQDQSPFVYVKRKIEPDESERVRALDLKGVALLPEPKRYYPRERLAAHVVGFVGTDNEGLEGAELGFDSNLRGKPGLCKTMRDGHGREIAAKREEWTPAQSGHDIVLTIDAVIQQVVESELDRAYRVVGDEPRGKRVRQQTLVKAAMGIVMDPGTGEVLAMASRPSFDPGQFAHGGPDAWRNRIITDCYEPGSTFKFITAAAALDAGLFSVGEKIFCENGVMRIAGRTIHDVHGYGWLTFSEVIEKSSNVGAVKIAKRLGPSSFYKKVRAFGFGSPTGVELPGEIPGIVRPLRSWTACSMASIPYGQEIAVTPIQLVAAMSAIANGGLLMSPMIIRSVRGPNGEMEYCRKPEVRARVVSEATAGRLRQILTRAAEQGTGKAARVSGYRVAGKTGTAQKLDPDGRYSHTRFVASFVGFVPADRPRLAILVMADEPRGSYYGGTVAAPVFGKIAESCLRYLEIPPSSEPEEPSAVAGTGGGSEGKPAA